MTTQEAQRIAERYHSADYGERIGNVYQVWEDGEITLQKSGPFLWQRTLFVVAPGVPGANIPMPVVCGKHSYAMVDNAAEAHEIQAAIYLAC